MARTITFNELRAFKDKLPDGSIHKIAQDLGLEIETVRNYFGGYNYKEGKSIGIHMEPGPDGGIVVLDDTTIFDKALEILGLTDYPEQIEEKENNIVG
ncbi:DNA-binding protein [Anaerorudis cellulosivorans]|uniref:DNA-binding protein n=1 Tax=Anaerorudis cellulosivorans TaxID=3397862 RepID=UPI0022211E69|nr:DNA-binding protein [Seramator thermalis]MCW1734687.1 DNA-binding protein [Seramator thermalis]